MPQHIKIKPSILIFFFQILVHLSLSISVPPTWITSSYVKANTNVIVSTRSNQNTNIPMITIIFASAFTSPPKIAYGIQNYQSEDSLNIQAFQIYRTALTSTSFNLKVVLGLGTTVWKVSIRYLAIDSLFPHPVNSFDDIPITYGQTTFPNFTINSTTLRSYVNVVNFTTLSNSQGFAYNKFSTPFTNNKIVLFLSSLDQDGTNDQSLFSVSYPLSIQITTKILTNQTFHFNLTHGVRCLIYKLDLSMIAFDEASIQASGLYILSYSKFTFTKDGGFWPVPQQFLTNLVIGIIQYTTKMTFSVIHFALNFQLNNGVFGVKMPKIVLVSQANSPNSIETVTYSLLYMKTWICPSGTFFNKSSNLCTCEIPNCATCSSLVQCSVCDGNYTLSPSASIAFQCTYCSIDNCILCINAPICDICDQQNNYFLSPTNTSCILCTIPYCINCSSLTSCSECNSTFNYFLNPSSTSSQDICIECQLSKCLQCENLAKCSVCDQFAGYYLDRDVSSATFGLCFFCNISNCLSCFSVNICSLCDQTNNFFLNQTTQQCELCNIPYCSECVNLTTCLICRQSDNYFINPLVPTSINDQCIACSILECIQCSSLNDCALCNQTNGYFLNETDYHCYPCAVQNCIQCVNLTLCAQCDHSSNYFLSSEYNSTNITSNITTNITDQCVLCQLTQCLVCSNLSTCLICNESNGYFLNISTLFCDLCQLEQCLVCSSLTTCQVCNNSNNFFLNPASQLCINKITCMDNILVLPQEQCDDGNNRNGDGCSDSCVVENNFRCQPNPDPNFRNSMCYFIGELTFKTLYIEKKEGLNQIEIVIEYGPPQLALWNNINFESMVSLSNMTGFDSYNIVKNTDGTFSIIANYNTDIQNMNITVSIDPALSGQSSLSRYQPMNKVFPAVADNNQSLFFHQEATYDMASKIKILAYVVAALSLLIFALGMCGYKLIGIQMMGVIQVCYLGLVTVRNLNPSFKALSQIWFVNGLSYFSLSKDYLRDHHSPNQLKGLSMYSQFVKNYNLTILMIVVPYLIAIICKVVSCLKKSKSQQYSQEESNILGVQKLYVISKRMICEYAFNGLMFSVYFISFCFASQVIYGIKNMDRMGVISVAVCALLLVITVVYFVWLLVQPIYFGQFKSSFAELQNQGSDYDAIRRKNSNVQQNNIQNNKQSQQQETKFNCKINKFWYNFLMLERFVIGSCLVFMMNLSFSLLLPISFFVCLGIVSLVRRPYRNFRHNIRFTINMSICIIMLTIYLTYNRVPQQSSQKNFMWLTVLPVLICILLLICIIYSAAFFIYQCKSLKKKKDLGLEYIEQFSKTQLNTQPRSPMKKQHHPDEINKGFKNLSLSANNTQILRQFKSKLRKQSITKNQQRNNNQINWKSQSNAYQEV